ncbi:MAG: hypothetical protein NZL98_06300 [Anaerolineales bacterium]|nr:hypothetical protein [Anaerolineales bacterium]MDW8226691.1 hypothetical protein [Anaerolineales bacterium]
MLSQADLPPICTNLPILLLYNLDPHWPEEDIRYICSLVEQTADELSQLGRPLDVLALSDSRLEDALLPFSPERYIVFNWCEAIPGLPNSEALVASILEQRGFTFTGSSACALARTKDMIKQLLSQNQVTTPLWSVYATLPIDGWKDFPAIVKPTREHCSLGIDRDSVVTERTQLSRRVAYILQAWQQPALVEEFIAGRELTVSLLGDENPYLLPVIEIAFCEEFTPLERVRTYASKFDKESAEYHQIQTVLPAVLSEPEIRLLYTTVLQAYHTAECRDYARFDVRMRDGKMYVIDVNHNPDLSPDSSFSLSARFAGLSHGNLISLLTTLAARRHPLYRYLV